MIKFMSFFVSTALVCCLAAGCSAQPKETSAAKAESVTEKSGDNSQAAKSVEWPVKTVQVVVPYKAGGGVDQAARLICGVLAKKTGQAFVITNKPEGNGIIAINELAKQEPDGYNLMVVSNRDIFGHIVNQIEGVEYGKDNFTYIASILETADCLFTQTEKYADFEQLIAAAKEKPGQITVAVSNNTGLATLEEINRALGIQLDGIVYSGGSEAFADLLGAHVDASLVAMSFCTQAQANGCGPVVTLTDKPVESLKGVPCVADYQALAAVSPMLRIFMGPSGLSPELVTAMTDIMDEIYVPDGEMVAQLNAQFDIPNYMTHEKLGQFVEENFALRQSQADQQ